MGRISVTQQHLCLNVGRNCSQARSGNAGLGERARELCCPGSTWGPCFVLSVTCQASSVTRLWEDRRRQFLPFLVPFASKAPDSSPQVQGWLCYAMLPLRHLLPSWSRGDLGSSVHPRCPLLRGGAASGLPGHSGLAAGAPARKRGRVRCLTIRCSCLGHSRLLAGEEVSYLVARFKAGFETQTFSPPGPSRAVPSKSGQNHGLCCLPVK